MSIKKNSTHQETSDQKNSKPMRLGSEQEIFAIFSDHLVKETPAELHKIKRNSAKLNRSVNKKEVQSDISEAKYNVQLVNSLHTTLTSEFGSTHTIKAQKGPNNSVVISLPNKTHHKSRYYPEIMLTVKSDNTIDIDLFTHWHHDSDFFATKNLTLDQVIGEMENIKDIIKEGAAPEDNIFKKKSHEVKIDEFRKTLGRKISSVF